MAGRGVAEPARAAHVYGRLLEYLGIAGDMAVRQ
jgi:hypothetical protein